MKKVFVLVLLGFMSVALTGCDEAPVATIEPEGVETILTETIEIENIEVKGIEVEPITVTCGNTVYWAD